MKLNKLEMEMPNRYAREQFFICSTILVLLGMVLLTVAFIFNNTHLGIDAAVITLVFLVKHVRNFPN